jgi:hypothetical protein
MAKRRKKLRRRIYTYQQLESRLVRVARRQNADTMASAAWAPEIRLYGNVWARGGSNTIRIYYKNRDKLPVNIASVYLLPGGVTGYAVHGFGTAKHEDKKLVARYYPMWKRYVTVFTPWDLRYRLRTDHAVLYRVQDGSVVERGTVTTAPDSPSSACVGAAITQGRWNAPPPKAWLANPRLATFPKFRARALAFYRSLKRRLASGLPAIVQLTGGAPTRLLPTGDGLVLIVMVPGTETQRCKTLYVMIRMHDNWSRGRLKISHDYGYAHSHVMALEDGKAKSETLEWKSTRTALVGIHEWVNGTLYIPGPSH